MWPLMFFCVAFLAAYLFVWAKPRTPRPVPENPVTIGPDYMEVWATEKRVNFKLRSGHVFMLDRRVAGELAAWLEVVKT